MAEVDALGAGLPDGARFVAPPSGATPGWSPGRPAPATADLDACVACGLCLPHCPTYRLTGEESASPRGRIAAIRAVHEGGRRSTGTFAGFMDACLVCRACEDVCPSHAPFGRMMEAAREQIEPTRGPLSRFGRWVGFHWLLPHPTRDPHRRRAAAASVRPLLPRRDPPRRAASRASVRAAPPRDRTAGRRDRTWDRRAPLGVRAGPVVPRGEPRDDPRPRGDGLARHGPPRPGVLRRPRRAQRPARGRGPVAGRAPRRRSAGPTPWS